MKVLFTFNNQMSSNDYFNLTHLPNPIQVPFTAVRDEEVPAVEAHQVSSVPGVALYVSHVELSAGARVHYESGKKRYFCNFI